ncbi:hypothetical protein BTA51_24655 [Hahella sp. CCB-MM4]|uniref:putative quinol monooxygenase n=1 Tax=Hahella sp. (strain CCB-MM4) TaxID=1926491 RepID=UPI000B9C13A8|nr:putative quinol monooxygenase [Hahella sp. CCB-MM4]OZG70774.1 hypothetical protein BTA51_24655 [Hahella sp. CCB-MM4]
MNAYCLTAHIRVSDAERLELARRELSHLVQHTRQEEGCAEFRIFEDADVPGEFWLWEVWNGEEGFKAHMDAAHTKRYFNLNLTEVLEVKRVNALEDK